MRPTPVVAAIVSAMIGAVVPACDLVFAPGKGPGATSDAPVADDGANGGDASTTIDAPPGTPDAPSPADASIPPVDATCGPYVCYAPDPVAGTPNPGNPGVAGCETAVDDACTTAMLVPIDVCTCTASPGSPELYVFPAGSTAVIAFVGPAPAANWSLTASADPGNCFGGGACTHEGPCFPGTPLWVWNVPIVLGSNQFQIFDDNGGGCGPAFPAYTFTISL